MLYTKKNYVDGLLHSDGDEPAIERPDGMKIWYNRGKKHRIGQPAVIYGAGHKIWFSNDIINRLDGPAVEYADGKKEYYIDGRKYSEESFYQIIGKPN